MMPVNAAGGFSLDCVTRYILFFDSVEVSDLLEKMRTIGYIRRTSAFLVVLIPASLVYVRFAMAGAEGDVGFVANLVCSVLYGLFVMFGRNDISTINEPVNEGKQSYSKWGWPTTIATFFTLAQTFAFPILGLQQMSAPTMYANIRYYGPSNHYLVPVGILGDDILFGGGLIYVLKSTSQNLNIKIGYIQSPDVFPPRVLENIDIARNMSHKEMPPQCFPMCMFNPHSRDLLMDDYLTSNPLSEGSEFYPFLLPLSAVREALQEAARAGEQFTVTLADAGRSANIIPTEIPSPSSKQFVIGTALSCALFVNGNVTDDDCIGDKIGRLLLAEQPTQGFLNWVISKLLVPYPKIIGMAEEVCMS